MKRFSIFLLAMTLAMPVFADGRRHHGNHGYRGPSPYNHYHRGFRDFPYRGHEALPYAGAAIGLAILGAIWYDQYLRQCYKTIIDYDEYNQPIFRVICP